MKHSVLAIALLGIATTTGIPCAWSQVTSVPGFTWMADPCPNWDCAFSTLMLASGDPFVVVLPLKNDIYRWIVLRRIPSGSIYLPPEHPLITETFGTLQEAAIRFRSLDPQSGPILVTTLDGFVVITYLKVFRQRPVNRR